MAITSMNIPALPNQPQRDPESERPALLPDCLRTRLWMPGWHFDMDASCLLWLQHQDGRVQVLRLWAHCLDSDELLADLVERLDDLPDSPVPFGIESGYATSIPDAPIKPRERRHQSWAWKRRVPGPCGVFEAGLDKEILSAFECLDWPCVSVRNYNLLLATPRALRARRFQALAEFPPLVAPVLGLFSMKLSLDRPLIDMRQEDAPPARPIHRLARHAASVLHAIDNGDRLVDVLARFYRIDRALVRSPLCRKTWQNGDVDLTRLQIVNALPSDARPRDYAGLCVGSSASMPVRFRTPKDFKRYGRVFASGWVRTWHRLMKRYGDDLSIELLIAREFLEAALDQAKVSRELTGFNQGMLGLAWLAVRGPASLIDASKRWRAQRLVESFEPDASVLPLFDTIEWPTGHARELTTWPALCEEGASMHHCVSWYWRNVLHDGICIAHVETMDGEMATAEYAFDSAHDTQTNEYRLRQLLGPANAQPSKAMQRLAADIVAKLNDPELREKRKMRQVEANQESIRKDRRVSELMAQPIDEKTRAILVDVFAYCVRQDDWRGFLDASNPAACKGWTGAYDGMDVFDDVIEDQFDNDDDSFATALP